MAEEVCPSLPAIVPEEIQTKTFKPWTNKRKRQKEEVKSHWIICDVTQPTFSSPTLGPVSPAAAPLGRLVFRLGVSPWRVHDRSFVSSHGTAGRCHDEGTGTLQLSGWPNVPVSEKSRFFFFFFARTVWHCAEMKAIMFCCKQELARPECWSR